MAINRGVLGSQTGSMGGITASNWKGRNVYKQKVPSTNSSNTPAQAAQRRKFAALAKLAGQMGPAIRIGYNSAAAKVTEQNAFVTANFAAVDDNGTISTVDYTKLKLGTGIVAGVEALDILFQSSDRGVVLTWSDNSDGSAGLPSDILQVVFVNTLTGEVTIPRTEAMRSDGTAGYDTFFPVGTLAANVRGYAFFKRATSKATSPSSTVVAHA